MEEETPLAKLIGFPNEERYKELNKIKDKMIKEFDGMNSKEIALVFKLVKDVVDTKLIFIV